MKKHITFLSISLFLFLLCSNAALATSVNFSNPLGSNMSNVDSLLKSAYSYLAAVAGTIAVVFILIGAVMYTLSGGKMVTDKDGGKSGMAVQAKKTIMYAVGGLAIVVAAPVFWRTIADILGSDTSKIGTTTTAVKVATNVLNLLLGIVGSLAIIGLIIGGIQMFFASGDDKKYEIGKAAVKYSLYGIVIALGALVIAQQITNLMGG